MPRSRCDNLESEGDFRKAIEAQTEKVADHPLAKSQLLGILDMLWMTNLEDLEALQESVGLRAYGQRDPLVEYRQEASRLFKAFWGNFNAWVFANMFKLAGVTVDGIAYGIARNCPAAKLSGRGCSECRG